MVLGAFWVLILTFSVLSCIPVNAMTASTTTSTAAAKAISRVAIVGGGISGCASARRLAQLAPSAEIAIYEIGRGPGGRASTRKTRSLPHLCVNHGAPYADIRSELGKSIVSSLDSAIPYTGIRGSLDSTTGGFVPESTCSDDEPHFVTGTNGEMSRIAASLVSGISSIETKYKTMVRGLSRTQNGEWELLDKNQERIGTADWLVVAGSGIAHPRWSTTFGGEPPLIAAEQDSPDPKLREALDKIAKQKVSPVLATFAAFSGPAAREWLSLDYDMADVQGSSVLSRVMIQGGTNSDDEEWCSVVLHSTEAFALENTGVYGASSSAARIGNASSDSSREEELVGTMLSALSEIPSMPMFQSKDHCDYGPMLHRWGNAFPKGDPLSEDLAFLPNSKVAFCGDYVETEARFGSFEGALLSGTSAGEKIANSLQNE